MNKTIIFNKVKEIFETEFDFYTERIELDTDIDSIRMAKLDKREFLLQVEEYFELRIPTRHLSSIHRVRDLVDCLHRLI